MNSWQYNTYSDYRKRQENIATNYFSQKGLPVSAKYSFILNERNNWNKNIILEKVVQYIEDQKLDAKNNKVAFPLHKYLHHGLSSQAMLFNLFGEPLIDKNYAFFQEIFQFSDIQIDNKYELKFEHYNRDTFNESQQQPTSFDFAVNDKTGLNKNIFLEAKYVETEFGGCSAIEGGECEGLNPVKNPDLCYLIHKGRNYWQIMKKHQLEIAYENSPICPFVIYYQFYRELMFALENNGYFVILIDKRNPAFGKSSSTDTRGLIPILLNQIQVELKNQIKVIYIQDVLSVLVKFGYNWVGEFREKYGIIN